MLSCTGKRSHRHTILHVSFSNSFGLASARPTPQGLSGAPKKYENLIHLLGYSWFYSSKLWHHRFFRNGSAPFSLILIACGIFHLGCWHINYEGIPTLVERYVNIHLSTNVIGYCDSINFYGIFNDDPRNRWIPGETISLLISGIMVLLAIRTMFVKVK